MALLVFPDAILIFNGIRVCCMADAAWEVIWLQNLLEGLGYEQHAPTKLYGDNNGVIAIA